jgi:UDP-N-acetylmuramoyl-L-alanyl-D-glutamate--2,6-diaminopimelate ligase
LHLTDLVSAERNVDITGVALDSRQVKKGYLFAALPGSKTDGSKYLEDAATHGAAALLVSEKADLENVDLKDAVIIRSDNPRRLFSKIAARFYKSQPAHLCAVTGTSGKTSVVSFTQQLWHLSGIKSCASLGTLGVRGPGIYNAGSLTTPDPVTLYAEIADLTAVGITHLALEASSHGLDQFRLDGLRVTSAAFTNLSHDHLDYHKTMEAYFDAKKRLFSDILPSKKTAVINADDPYGQKLIEICKERGQPVLSFGKAGEEIKLVSRKALPTGQNLKLDVHGQSYDVVLPFVGEFQVMNALCALGLTLAEGAKAEEIVPHFAELRGVAGRLQLVKGHPKGAAIYVDYAHKPAALEQVLKSLRPHTKGRLVCVFGCGGDRDEGKRAIMGKIASDFCDQVVVTDDNPRSEDPEEIRSMIMSGAVGAREIGDRAEAINWAVQDLQSGDVLVVAGKGHEKGQTIGDEVLPFDDVEEVKKAIEGLK